MTDLKTALSELLSNPDFKEGCKKEARLRIYSNRIKKNTLGDAAAVSLLQEFGYVVKVLNRVETAKSDFT